MKRILFGFLWAVVIYYVVSILVGLILGFSAGARHPGRPAAEVAREGVEAFQVWGPYLVGGAIALAVFGAATGILPGTKIDQTRKQGARPGQRWNDYGTAPAKVKREFPLWGAILGGLVGILIYFIVRFCIVNFPRDLWMSHRAEKPIPQDPERQEQRYRDMLAWNRRTLAGAYDKVGKKDPRWAKPAREALEAAARNFSYQIDPPATLEEVYAPAKQAIDAGCDDPLILYLYARSSYKPNDPGQEELARRYATAAIALEPSAYPPFRRATGLYKAGLELAALKHASTETRQEAARLLDVALALLPNSVREDEWTPDLENLNLQLALEVIRGHRQLNGDYRGAFDRVDAALARIPTLRAMRLQVRGDFLINSGWEARGEGTADTVASKSWELFVERLTGARRALKEAWEIKPGDPVTANMMLIVEKGIGSSRSEMEKWFERAMEANGNNKTACEQKMDWLNPKWHGSREEVLAFGQACRATNNWRAGITLLLADAHRIAVESLPEDEKSKYLHSQDVWNGIQAVYEEYLRHHPDDHLARSRYAAYACVCGWYAESKEQFGILNDNVAYPPEFPEAWMKQARSYVAAHAAPQPSAKPRE